MPEITALIPAHNEAARIGDTVRAVFSIPGISEILVVDDGSTDETAAAVRAAGARIYSLPFNLGKGGALNHGAAVCRGDVILLLDADLGASAAEGIKLLPPILRGAADMTVARFPRAGRRGGFGLVKGLARAGIRCYTGLQMESPLSGQRAVTRRVLERLLPFAPGYGVEVALTIKAARLGFKVLEVPVNMTHQETGRDWAGFVHRGRQFGHVLRTLAGAWRG
ncbi:glycosyltransferase family 2 protein [Desulfotomaculum copahuensis]|uniref:Glucosyl-3-phosphoglycerate synthase n=1 Tax=Desulfotomaculum copahuensis TaxID=1838280 RepID=A0A1B7LIV5_9FIRM|nr:glycosyltransferase family 2 protein [Desulfotomaculum copahuensis]OAT86509.1 glycosyl transferase [Desulfotomaculum copahuensis]